MAEAVGCCLFDTAIGRCGIAWTATGALRSVQLPETSDDRTLGRLRRWTGPVDEAAPPPAIAAVIARVQAALQGNGDALLDVELDEEGVPPFNSRVYAVARAIPIGSVVTYGELARELGPGPFFQLRAWGWLLRGGYRATPDRGLSGLATPARVSLLTIIGALLAAGLLWLVSVSIGG